MEHMKQHPNEMPSLTHFRAPMLGQLVVERGNDFCALRSEIENRDSSYDVVRHALSFSLDQKHHHHRF